MDKKTVEDIVQSVLIDQYNVKTKHFLWDAPLITLSEKFRILGFLVELEHLLQSRLSSKLSIIENIDTTSHTPKDLVDFIITQLQ